MSPRAPSPYLAAVRAARANGRRIDIEAARALERALLEYARELEAGLVDLPADAALAAQRSAAVVRQAAERLEARISYAVAHSTQVAYEDTLDIWREATERVALMHDVPRATLGAVARPELTTAQAFAAANPAPTWRSAVTHHVDAAAREATGIVQRALLDGMHPEQLARRLRPYVLGRDQYPEALREYIDAGGTDTRAAAYTVTHNAKRIAFSETHTARKEAEVAHFNADPFIEMAQWTLSPNRGTQRLPDACDALAGLDWYGLGAGVFPLTKVPTSPHPWDRCEVLPIVRPLEDVGQARPSPALRLNPWTVPLPREAELTPLGALRVRSVLARLLVEPVRPSVPA